MAKSSPPPPSTVPRDPSAPSFMEPYPEAVEALVEKLPSDYYTDPPVPMTWPPGPAELAEMDAGAGVRCFTGLVQEKEIPPEFPVRADQGDKDSARPSVKPDRSFMSGIKGKP